MARLTPQQKKKLEYERDLHRDANVPHAYRRIRPMLKAVASRADRRRAERLLDGLRNGPTESVIGRAEDDALTAVRFAHAGRTENFWPRPVISVRERVERRIAGKANIAAWHFFDAPYDPAAHRDAFTGFLDSVVNGSGAYARAMAEILSDALDPDSMESLAPYHRNVAAAHGAWLRAFFRDEPAWEPRLRAWIDRLSGAGE